MTEVWVKAHPRNGRMVAGHYRTVSNLRWHKEQLTPNQEDQVMNEYKQKRATNVKMEGNRISLDYDNKHLSNPFVSNPNREDVASWSHTNNQHYLMYDRKIKPNRLPGVLVHESVEQYVAKEKGLPYSKAHEVALAAERPFVENKLKQDWKGYEISVLNTPD